MPADFDGAKIKKMIEFSTFLQKKMHFWGEKSRKIMKIGGNSAN